MENELNPEESFNGEIGNNMFYSKEEREEDILETLYLWWKEGKPLTIPQICMDFDITKREMSYYIKQMVKHGYLREPEKNGNLELTAFGKAEGAECLLRHQHLTQFLQMICGLDEERAEENACRMEHVVSGEVLHGICDFIKYGDTYDRVVKNANLRIFYDEGIYEFCMSIYCTEKRYPRVLAKENDWFSDSVFLEISNEKSYFYLKETAEHLDYDGLWYKSEFEWKKAVKTKKGFQIPTDVFSFTFSPKMPVTEGYCILAFCSEKDAEPAEKNYRELNVHIWQGEVNEYGSR